MEYKIRRILDINLIILTGPLVWEKNAILPVSETGMLIWEMLSRGTDLASLERAVTDEFDVEPSEARKDILTFIRYLIKREFLIK